MDSLRRHPRHGRLLAPAERGLGERLRRWLPLRLREGDRGRLLHQPLLRSAVQRLGTGRHGARRLPLCEPPHFLGCRSGALLRAERRRLECRRPDPTGPAGHRVQPLPGLRQHLLQHDPGAADRVDPRLCGDLPFADRSRPDGVHRNLLVVAVRGFAAVRYSATALGKLLDRGRCNSGGLERLRHLAVHRLRPVRG